MWQAIEKANPYFLKLASPAFGNCVKETQTEMPYVRIDWFVFAASKPPLYHVLLNLPQTDAALEDLLRVNVAANIQQERAIRAAFNRSGVSQHNRLIEWHKSPYGSYWKSYDFGGSTGQKNLFQYPLGPTGSQENFKHDGGEIIFSLPNGLQGYLLVDEAGRRIDQGPTSIVSDPKRPDKTVTNGVSCMSCHYTGVIPKRDEVGEPYEPIAMRLPRLKISSRCIANRQNWTKCLTKTANASQQPSSRWGLPALAAAANPCRPWPATSTRKSTFRKSPVSSV